MRPAGPRKRLATPRPARVGAAALLYGALACLAACARPASAVREASIFSSRISLTIYGRADEALFEAVFGRLRELDASLNMWDAGSELARLGARAGSGPIPASAALVAAAARGLELARDSGGVFDPTVAPLVRLWGIGTKAARVPSPAEIEAARELVDWRRASADRSAGTVSLGPGQGLDFGALAKGQGALEGARILAAAGVRSALLDVGGCVAALGSAPGRKPWKIGVQDPLARRGAALGYLSLRDSTVATSGVYERYFEEGGRRYPHIMDARTGRPYAGPLLSATAALPIDRNADGTPLAIMVLGPDEGIALADRLGVPAVLVAADRRIYLSRAARPIFTLLDSSYSLVSAAAR